MDLELFKKTCSESGYANKKVVNKYIENTDKEVFDNDDLINVFRLNEERLNVVNPMYIDRNGYKSTKKYKQSDSFGNDRI